MKRFPLFLNLSGATTPIIGGGGSALRKARLLAAAGAKPLLIFPAIDPETKSELGQIAEFVEREPQQSDFADAAIAVIAVDDADLARDYALLAKDAGVLVNVVDQPALCDFTVPSIIERGRLGIAISTDGAGPVFARHLREKIESLLPSRAGALLDFADEYRPAVKSRIAEHDRRAFWESFFQGSIAEQVLSGDEIGAHSAMVQALNKESGARRKGVVHIVGAGPGDPELLTLKAFRLIQSADVVLYDRLITSEIMALVRRDADRIFVGKEKSNHAVPQSEIENKIVSLAREGKVVVRLKGGDPFVFGRGGEELDAVRAAGIPVYVTPGITSATGCAASANMALTHRDYAQAVTFVTGHAKGSAEPDLDWAALAALKNTLVIYMGVTKAASIAAHLIDNGREASTPIAIIENGTRPNEKIVKGALHQLGTLVDRHSITGPALLVIGEVAALADDQGLSHIVGNEREAA